MKERLKALVQRTSPDLLRIYRLCNYELEALAVGIQSAISPRQRANRRRLRRECGLKVHLASGPNRRPGWVNIDSSPHADLRLDLRGSLPLSNDSVAMIFCEHFLDHVQYPEVATRLLSECHRVLEPGGRVRLVLHDAELLAKAYVERDAEFFRVIGHPQPPFVRGLNFMFRFNDFHQFIHDFESIGGVLRDAGFETVTRSSMLGSQIPELNLDNDDPERAIQSLYVEALKASP